MDAISENRLTELHPELAQRLRTLDEHLIASSLAIRIRITQGFRSWNDQDAIYAQGRTKPGAIVTEARGGYSAHNFGYAADVAPDVPGFPDWRPDWNERDDRWNSILAIALNYKLAEGAKWRSFPDTPHLYLAELPATPDDEMRFVFREKGLGAVWETWEGRLTDGVV